MDTRKIELKDAFKTYTDDQDKIITPEETVKRFSEKLKSANLDILEDIVRIDNGRLDIPVYFSVCSSEASKVTGTKKQMGKGATPAQARASAVMELAERYSFFSFCKNEANFKENTFKDVRDKAIPFDLIAASVNDSGDDLEITEKIFSTLPLKWTTGYNLTQEKEVMIPFNWFFTINEFNGPSAGNCVEEALSQGICEIVERHVSSLISHEKRPVPLIRPESATQPLVVEMLNKYKSAGINLYISDFTLDMGIPSVAVLAYDPSTFPEKSEIVWTAGTTPDPQKALSRALTEVAQLAGDFNTASNYVASGLPKYSRIEDAGYIMNPGNTVNIDALPDLSNNNIRIEIENCLSALSKRGMEVIVIDATHPLLKIPAFYTIIPGAHFRERSLGTSVGMFSAKIITENNLPDAAIEKLNELDRMLPKKYYIKFYLGLSFLSLSEPLKALAYFSTALELDPIPQEIPSIYSYIGICKRDMALYREAIEAFQKAESYDNERTDIYNQMGFCHFKLKQHEAAIACFKKVLKLDPSSAIDYANIGSNYRDLGQREKAIQYYETALELDPSISFARENLAKLKS